MEFKESSLPNLRRLRSSRGVAFKSIFDQFLESGKDPLGWSSMCWLSWFWGLGCCSCPGLHLRLGASYCVPGLAFCFMGLGHLLRFAARNSPTTGAKTGHTAHVFTAQGGTRRQRALLSKTLIPIENFTILAWDFQSRSKISISAQELQSRCISTYGAIVVYREGLDRKFQSTIDRSKFSIPRAAIEFFNPRALWVHATGCLPLIGREKVRNQEFQKGFFRWFFCRNVRLCWQWCSECHMYCWAQPISLDIFCFPGRDTGLCRNPLC